MLRTRRSTRAPAVALGAALAAVALSGPHRGLRGSAVLLTGLLVLGNAGAAVNAHYDYFRTLGAVVGLAPDDEESLAVLLRRTRVPSRGVVASVTVPPERSGFAARPALVYVPPAWFARPRPALPVVADVPGFVERTLRTRPPGPSWAVAGLSEGGSCALVLALRHPGTFATFGDYSGLAGPRVGETNADTAPTVAALFGGSPQEFAAHEPADLLAARRYPQLGGWFEVGDADPEPLAAQQQLVPLVRRAGVATCARVVPAGGHTFDVFSAAFADSLPWLVARTDPARSHRAPCPPGS